MVEIPPKFAGRPPVNPEARDERTVVARTWKGAQGLADDVRHYGRWTRDEAETRIGHLYPPVEITPEMVRERPDLKPYDGRKLTVIAWLWARTVKSPNPAFVVRTLGGRAEAARELCYRLYTVCDRRKRAAEAGLQRARAELAADQPPRRRGQHGTERPVRRRRRGRWRGSVTAAARRRRGSCPCR